MPHEVETPPELAQALDRDPSVREAFDALAPSHRREYVRWVAEAKREDTRERRLEKAVEMLRGGTKAPG
jgi:uncharacterized protein YdeI (YjbR/CyaY-like superfamily)